MDYAKLADEIISKVGAVTYQNSLLRISSILDDLDPARFPGYDAEEFQQFVADVVIADLRGEKKHVFTRDIETTTAQEFISEGGGEMTVVVGSQATQRDKALSTADQLQRLAEVEEMLRRGMLISKISFGMGQESVNDWLADLCRGAEGSNREGLATRVRAIRRRVEFLRNLGRENRHQSGGMGAVRGLNIPSDELHSLNSRTLHQRYAPPHMRYDGVWRKRIERLRAET